MTLYFIISLVTLGMIYFRDPVNILNFLDLAISRKIALLDLLHLFPLFHYIHKQQYIGGNEASNKSLAWN